MQFQAVFVQHIGCGGQLVDQIALCAVASTQWGFGIHTVTKGLAVCHRRGKNLAHNHRYHSFSLNGDHLAVCVHINLISCAEFFFCENLMPDHKIDILLGTVNAKGICGRRKIVKPPFFSFGCPFFGVSVTVEDDSLMILECLRNKTLQSTVKILRLFQYVRKSGKGLCHTCVEDNIRSGDRLR